jgi:sugar phosphate isomerase/epimerase
MLLSLSSACLYLAPLRHLFGLAAETGYEGIELVMAPEVWLRGPGHVRTLVRDFGLPVCSIHQTMLPASPRGAGAARMTDAVEAALALECPIVVLHDAFVARWDDPRAERWLRELEKCQRRVEGSGTRLAVENPGWYHARDREGLFAHPLALVSFVRRCGLEVTFDTCHAGSAGVSVQDSYDILRERVINVHLADLKPGEPLLGLDTLRTLLLHHQMPGEGMLALSPFLARLAHGYAGPLTLEVSMAALHAWSPRQVRQRLAQAAAYVREAVRGSQPVDHVAEPA